MAVPKKRTGSSAQGHRRSKWKATKPETTKCTNCGEIVLTHTVCTACGYYKGKAASIKSPDYVETVAETKKAAKKTTKKTEAKAEKIEAKTETKTKAKAKKAEVAETEEIKAETVEVETVEAEAEVKTEEKAEE